MNSFNKKNDNYTLLIVDDIKQNIQLLATILEKEGYSIGYALSGKEALKVIDYTEFDLILLDYIMPEMNGVETCKEIKKHPRYINTPIIFITANQNDKILLDAFSAGAVDYITKPFKPLELIARIENHLKFKQARDDVEEASKIKSQFVATMSEEMKTPLQSILGITELLFQTGLNSQQYELLKTLKYRGENLFLIINDILEYSKLEAKVITLNSSEFNLINELDNLLTLVEIKTAQKKIDITYFIDSYLPPNWLGDSLRIRQILLHLINNAIKFTDSGEIIIKVEIAENHPENTNLFKIKFIVKDTGIGIDKVAKNKIFQSFSQIDTSSRKYGGSGLGLTISQQLVNLMGGEIHVNSEKNKGSQFSFSIPLEFSKHISIKDFPQFSSYTALVWDKNPNNRKFISINLKKLSIKVDETKNPEVLINKLSSPHNIYNLIFISIDNISLEAIKTINQLRLKNSAKLILIGFQDSISIEDTFSKIDYSYYLKKPLTYSSLYQCIKTLTAPQKKNKSTAKNQAQITNIKENENQSLKILLVEDNRINQKVISLQLKKLGYRADIVNDGKECLNVLTKQKYDILLMDCEMPVLDGYETTKVIRESETNGINTIIIGLSGNPLEDDKNKYLKIGMDDYLTKPIPINTLKDILNKWNKKK